ncbi:energy transducer TonB [Pseudomonas umsongensis]|jgi:TonB family protein|uniref:energy transducer TonB n=1 Tax=Pseudomonas umsongensis TaxID=198618 RepID=UPI00200AC0B1|nr:energy transducer TonB [Pseudomonas umsongensis]MCK8653801.1 energy transducer TonB [Pseudomonas umsongensis]
MRWFVLLLILVVLGEIQAEEFFLIPENNPKPIYPLALQRAGVVGTVRVGFTVKADGSISKVKIVQSDHPDLAEATRVAIAQWRFKPWTVDGDKPAEQDMVAPMVFGYDWDMTIDTNKWLNELRCRDLNNALVDTPEHRWTDSAAFYYTRAYLTKAFSKDMLSNERRLELITQLNRKVPIIVSECRSNPVSRYVRYLPQGIRKLL